MRIVKPYMKKKHQQKRKLSFSTMIYRKPKDVITKIDNIMAKLEVISMIMFKRLLQYNGIQRGENCQKENKFTHNKVRIGGRTIPQ